MITSSEGAAILAADACENLGLDLLRPSQSVVQDPTREGKLGIHQKSLKEQLAMLTYRLRVQRNKIESTGLMLQHRDKELFDKCVAARTTGDALRASLYANECAEIRKIVKVVLQSELALEQVITFLALNATRMFFEGA